MFFKYRYYRYISYCKAVSLTHHLSYFKALITSFKSPLLPLIPISRAFSNFDYFCFFLCYNCFKIIQLVIRLVKNLFTERAINIAQKPFGAYIAQKRKMV